MMNIIRKQEHEIVPMSEERAKEIQTMSDEDIDYSDIPPLDEAFFQNAELVKKTMKDATRQKTIFDVT